MIGIILIVLLIFLIFFLPYGVDAGYEGGEVRLSIKAGPLRIRLLPKKLKTEEQQEKARLKKEKKKAKKAAKAEKKKAKQAADAEAKPAEKKPKKKPDIEFLWALVQMGIRAIRRFFRSFSIDHLGLRLIVGGGDPFSAAQLYGYACAAAEAAPALAGGRIRVRKKDIEIGCDFLAESMVVEGRIVISLQLFRIVLLALAFGVEFLRWKLKHRSPKSDGTDERMDNNGREQDQ